MTEGELPTLPHYLRAGLRIVFVGYNPGIVSAIEGHYYARPGNVFWRQLSASGLVDRVVTCEDDGLLMDEAGIGFTDMCPRPTVRAGELRQDEIRDGAARLHMELLENQPDIACFSGKGIYEHFGRWALKLSRAELSKRAYGEQPERIGQTGLWVIPSSSGLASKWHRERWEWMMRLAAEVSRQAGR